MKNGESDFFLLRFAHQHLNFRLAEYRALLEAFASKDISKTLTNLENDNDLYHFSERTPFIPIINVQEQDIKKVVSRAILIKRAYHCIAKASSKVELVRKIKSDPSLWSLIMTQEEQKHASFKFIVDTFGKRLSLEEHVDMINEYSFLSLGGHVRMRDPDMTFYIIGRVRDENDVFDNDLIEEWYFGRLVQESDRHSMDVFDLKKRSYIGTTSMDAELSLIMCNLAKVKYGHMIYDPFVGTGSFLLAGSHFGAFTLGSDIDGRQIRGKNGSSIQSNIQQYGLKGHVLDVLVFDITCHPFVYTDKGVFDAIITDPPYGVRAGAKKIASRSSLQYEVNDPMCPTYPRTDPYPTEQVIYDLVEFSSRYLVLGGRLVYWQPSPTKDPDLTIPEHPCMKLIEALEQPLSGWSRWLIVMEKVQHTSGSSEEAPTNWVNFRQLLFKK